MSYEFNAANGRFELSNPYRLENLALLFCGGVAVVAAIYLFLGARNGVAAADADSIKSVVVGFLLLLAGVRLLSWALSQLRYYFGRGRPADLANPEVRSRDPNVRANWLKGALRHNSLEYAEPQGPIEGLLHNFNGNLVFAPRLIRQAAEAQFSKALLICALLLTLLVSRVLYPSGQATDWIAIIALFPLVHVLWTAVKGWQSLFVKSKLRNPAATIALLVALPILGPPLIARIAAALPDIGMFHVARTATICLLILLAAQALFFIALMQQLPPRPAINMSCEQRTVSVNGHPGKLFEELGRLLQSRWTETIPNRQYLNVPVPDVFSGQSGSFSAELLQETQPTPAESLDSGGPIAGAVAQPRLRTVVALLLLGVVTFLVGAYVAVSVPAHLAVQGQAAQFLSSCILAVVLVASAIFSLRCAHLLLGRVDFNSVLLWVEFAGTYEESAINIGNQFTTALSSTKKVINVETMTMRVWVAELSTVILWKDGPRDLYGMRGRPDLASYFADHLTLFAGQMSSVVAPVSQTDQARIAAMGVLQKESGLATPAAAVIGGAAAVTASPPAALAATSADAHKFCTSCGAAVASGASFCGNCGTRLRSA